MVFKYIDCNVSVQSPLDTAHALSRALRNDLQCDLVICLSHLGFNAAHQSYQDVSLAAQSSGIDFILGGNSHTFLEAPKTIYNTDNQRVVVSHAGCGGLLLGRIDLEQNTEGTFRITRQEYIPTGASSPIADIEPASYYRKKNLLKPVPKISCRQKKYAPLSPGCRQ